MPSEEKYINGGEISGVSIEGSSLEGCKIRRCILEDCELVGSTSTPVYRDTEATKARLTANAETIASLQTENGRLNDKGIELVLEVERRQKTNETLYRTNETLLDMIDVERASHSGTDSEGSQPASVIAKDVVLQTCIHGGFRIYFETSMCPPCKATGIAGDRAREIRNLEADAEIWKQRCEQNAGLLADERKESERDGNRIRELEAVIAAGKTKEQRLLNLLRSATERRSAYTTDSAAMRVLLAATEARLYERDMAIKGYREQIYGSLTDHVTPECEDDGEPCVGPQRPEDIRSCRGLGADAGLAAGRTEQDD